MRLLQIGKYFPPAAGGIEAVAAAIRDQLAPMADVTTLVANHDAGDAVEAEPSPTGRQLLIRSRSLGRLFSMPLCPTLPGRVARLTRLAPAGQAADVVLLHHPNPMAAAAITLARPACPLVVFYHSDIVRQKALGAACGPLIHRVLAQAARILVTSPTLLLHCQTLRRYRSKCTVVPLGIDPARWLRHRPPAIAAGDPMAPVFAAGPTVLFAGRLVYYKGLDVLIEAMAALPKANLVLVGQGPLGEALRRQAERLDLGGRVHFAGRVSDERLCQYYHAADVLVLPSTAASEAFGLVQLEAMAAGTPVVSTALKTGVPWVNRDRRTGRVVAPSDPAALAAGLAELLDNRELARRYGSNGRRRVLRRFTLEHFRRRLWRVLTDVVRSAGASPVLRRGRLLRPGRRRPTALETVEARNHA